MLIEVLGSQCPPCQIAERVVRETVKQIDPSIEVKKVESMQTIVQMGALSLPAIAIDGIVVMSGRIPRPEELIRLIDNARHDT